jgi:hypothetical protein
MCAPCVEAPASGLANTLRQTYLCGASISDSCMAAPGVPPGAAVVFQVS